jgi:trehalose-6-phosphate synthase
VRPSVLDQEDWWPAYEAVNERMVDAAAAVAGPGASVWVHDYHLRREDLRIGFFLHIPFPPPQLFQRLSWRHELLAGLLGRT